MGPDGYADSTGYFEDLRGHRRHQYDDHYTDTGSHDYTCSACGSPDETLVRTTGRDLHGEHPRGSRRARDTRTANPPP